MSSPYPQEVVVLMCSDLSRMGLCWELKMPTPENLLPWGNILYCPALL